MVDRVWPEAAVVSIITPKVERLARKRGSPVVKRGFRVRLNGADHQWGKDPPKEVVG